MSRRAHFVLIAILLLTGAGFISAGDVNGSVEEEPHPATGGRLPIQGEGGIGASELDFTGELVPVLERDAIPALDIPPFVGVSRAGGLVASDELVLGVVVGGEARAYPLRVMAAHEVVNDEIAGTPVVVTFCPLCFTGVAYDRRVNGEVRTFGVSGFLLNSSLVLFDRERETLWSQVTGTALNGAEEGQTLHRVSARQTDLASWIKAHPETLVLDVAGLGGDVRYPPGRFESYFASSAAGLIPLSVRGDLRQKALVAGLLVDGSAVAFEIDPEGQRVENVEIAGERIVVWIDGSTRSASAYRKPDAEQMTLLEGSTGQAELVAEQSARRWKAASGFGLEGAVDLQPLDVTISFWFGWAAFFPDTALYPAP